MITSIYYNVYEYSGVEGDRDTDNEREREGERERDRHRHREREREREIDSRKEIGRGYRKMCNKLIQKYVICD